MDGQQHRPKVLGLEAEDMPGQLDLGAQSGSPERGSDGEIAAPSVVAEVAHVECEAVHLDTVESLEAALRAAPPTTIGASMLKEFDEGLASAD